MHLIIRTIIALAVVWVGPSVNRLWRACGKPPKTPLD